MSHYAVAVLHRANQNIEDLIAPYNENIEVAPYIAETKQEIIERGWEKRNDYIYNLKRDPAYYSSWHMDDFVYATSDDEIYNAMANSYNDEAYDEDGNRWSTYNPVSKWDWWSYGGRFSDMLKLKPDSERIDPDYTDDVFCDSAPLKDIDFSIDVEAYNDALRFWDVVVDDAPLEEDEDAPFTIWSKEYYKSYYRGREDYARRCAQFSTFAVVTPDGKWHEPGQMGWFGCSDTTPKDECDWYDHYYERFINGQDPDLILTIIDCHI